MAHVGYLMVQEENEQAGKRPAIEGVTPTMSSILYAESCEDGDDDDRRHTTFHLLTIPEPGSDMPPSMMAAYDRPKAVPAWLQQDIERLLAALEART